LENETAWMAGAGPAMTAGQAFIPSIVTGSCARSSRNSRADDRLPGRFGLAPVAVSNARAIAALAAIGEMNVRLIGSSK
jgi:hypothetical protein